MTTRDELQRNTFEWAKETFGDVAIKPHERARRFLEEALELVQAQGVSFSEVITLVNYTYGRPVGHVEQEIGGVCITLLSYCESVSVSAGDAEAAEWARVQRIDQAHFRARHAAKAAAGVAAVEEIRDAYHQHLDICEQCREHPFDLCSAGAKLLREAAGREI